MTPSWLSHVRPRKPSAPLAGAALSAGVGVVLAAAPELEWSPQALLVVGGVSILAGVMLFKGNHRLIPTSLRQSLASFMLVYGACTIAGGLLGHYSPYAPLEAPTSKPGRYLSLWNTASTADEATHLIEAALLAKQKTLVVWTKPECDRCRQAMALSALNPEINPRLQGYRLIQIAISPDTAPLQLKFGVTSMPALTLFRGDGTIPNFGRINDTIDAQSIMDLLELESQAEADYQ